MSIEYGNNMAAAWKGGNMGILTERKKEILETFARIMPELSESDQSYLIGLGEGLAMRVGRNAERDGKRVLEEAAV